MSEFALRVDRLSREKLWLWGVNGVGMEGSSFHLFFLASCAFEFPPRLSLTSELDLSSRIGYLAAFGPI